jgi:hypothetical protein
MNLSKLKQAEEVFLYRYPGGFDNPEIIAVRTKKHNVDKLISFAHERFAKRNFRLPDLIVQDMINLVSRSSIISRFEKPRFRDLIQNLSLAEQNSLREGLEELLHGVERTGFKTILDILQSGNLAKWSLTTACQAYFHPHRDVLIKPTTVKGILEYFELNHLHYKPTPTWAFYEAYRFAIHEMKSKVDPLLSPSNLAFSWFLLLSFHGKLL